MEAWMAFVSIMAIVAIVVVAGGLIAFIGHMIIGAFDNNKQGTAQESKDVIDYAQYKQLTDGKQVTENKEYDFEAINESKAQQEKDMLENEAETIFELNEDKDDELEAIENRLKESNLDAEKVETELVETEELKSEDVKEEITSNELEEDELDDFDLDGMLDEISNDVIEEEKTQVQDEEIKMSDELASYSIDDLLAQAEAEQEAEETPVEEVKEVVETTEEVKDENPQVEEIATEEIKAVEETEDEGEEEGNASVDETLIEEEIVEQDVETEEVKEEASVESAEIAALKAQLADLNKQLEEARAQNVQKVQVVSIDMTEDECVARLETLEERLKNVKKEYKTNAKEYRPLKKVMNDLERYQTKLRRKEAVVAKKKVALYGVNNYVDIDKERAEKLANELELLDGLRLSVSHCEEVINANKDRFPILEHTNQILEDQISHIEADIASTQATLQKIREKNGTGEGSNEGTNE